MRKQNDYGEKLLSYLLKFLSYLMMQNGYDLKQCHDEGKL